MRKKLESLVRQYRHFESFLEQEYKNGDIGDIGRHWAQACDDILERIEKIMLEEAENEQKDGINAGLAAREGTGEIQGER